MATDAGGTNEHPTTPTPRRRWFQFSLRTLMVFVVVTSVPLGWLGIKVKEARKDPCLTRFAAFISSPGLRPVLFGGRDQFVAEFQRPSQRTNVGPESSPSSRVAALQQDETGRRESSSLPNDLPISGLSHSVPLVVRVPNGDHPHISLQARDIERSRNRGFTLTGYVHKQPGDLS
jgi:hypothetical protein